jgi:hypothetical protein
MRRLGCSLGRVCCPLPLSFVWCPQFSSSPGSSRVFSFFPVRHPSQATLARRLGGLGGSARDFTSRLAAFLTCDTQGDIDDTSRRFAGLPLISFSSAFR